MGVAMLAKAFHTGINVGDIAKSWVKPIAKVEPKLHEFYNEKFKLYKRLYPALKELKL